MRRLFDENRGHAHVMRYDEIAGHVLKHGGFTRIDVVAVNNGSVSSLFRLRDIVSGFDTEDAVEQAAETKPVSHVLRMGPRPICEDNFTSGQFSDRLSELRGGFDPRNIDIVYIFKKVTWFYPMFGHQPAQGGAMPMIVSLLDVSRLIMANIEKIGDIFTHAAIYLGKQIVTGRVKRVVEIENPGIDQGKPRGGIILLVDFTHQIRVTGNEAEFKGFVFLLFDRALFTFDLSGC